MGGDNFMQVEGHPDLSRDTNSGAIINRNRSAYDRAKKRAKEAQESRDEIRTATREINNIKSEMHEIKSLLEKLVSKE
jgi:methyl-accepting chemotaxis protein